MTYQESSEMYEAVVSVSPRSKMPRPMNVTQSGRVRRLPIYLLLDCSGSMRGAPIGAVQVGIERFISEVRQDAQACEAVSIGVITFNYTAELITNGLVPAHRFAPPKLVAEGKTCLGKALQILMNSLDSDVQARIPGEQIGDFKPLAFILTDGEPTDKEIWPAARQALIQRIKKGQVNVITVGCGPSIDEHNLMTIAMGDTYYFKTDDMTKSFSMFFDWASQSVIHHSSTITQSGSFDKAVVSALPRSREIQVVR